MMEEMNAFDEIKTWDIVDLLEGRDADSFWSFFRQSLFLNSHWGTFLRFHQTWQILDCTKADHIPLEASPPLDLLNLLFLYFLENRKEFLLNKKVEHPY